MQLSGFLKYSTIVPQLPDWNDEVFDLLNASTSNVEKLQLESTSYSIRDPGSISAVATNFSTEVFNIKK